MGLLDRSALRRSQKLIAPFAEDGEEAIDFDVGRVGVMEVDLIATERALYVAPKGLTDVRRLPYKDMAEVMWMQIGSSRSADWILGVALAPNAAGESLQVQVEIRAPRGLGRLVEERAGSAD